MAIQPGARLGPYEILSAIGAGGMGEVYRAHDTTLDRDVAIKVLPEAFSHQSERLARFRREAKVLAALNHPNIAGIYGLAEFGDHQFLVLELVEGKTLAERMVSGAVPVAESLQICEQITEALEHAHNKGITHRDIKPDNVKVTPEGRVKVLDFGLARLWRNDDAEGTSPSNAQTLSALPTMPGSIMGTPAYMSPEQARGETVDFRSDQFSLGTILYELLTGQRAFRRETVAETLAAVIREEPAPAAQVNRKIPPPVQWTLERCLKKNPGERYASSRDLVRDFAALRERLRETPVERRVRRPHNLPVQRTSLVGREAELAAAKGLLLSEKVRLLTLTGPGGSGKTRLGIQVAVDVAEQYPGGAHFVSLAGIRDPALVASAIAQAVGVRETEGRLLPALQEALGSQEALPTLLLLDNFEHLLDAAPLVSELLEGCATLKVLVTSRAVLHVYGEHELPVPPLPLPDQQRLPPLAELSCCPAVALFVERATAVKADFSLTRENAAEIAEICVRLDGVPLAIELAAARIKLLPPSAMLPRLQSRLQILTGGARDLPARQRTLRGAIDWSYDLLSPPEQILFRRLSVFIGGCTLEAAEAVANTQLDLTMDLLEGMQSLVDKSLLQQAEQPGGEARFKMLETIREYGSERLVASGEESATKRALAAYCLVLAEEGPGAESGAIGQAAWTAQCNLEYDNFRVALDWLTEAGDADWGLRLAIALFPFWATEDHGSEGVERLSAVLKLPAAAARTQARAQALLAAASLGKLTSYSLYQESLEISRELGDRGGVIAGLNNMAVTERYRGNYAGARSLLEECLQLSQATKRDPTIARALSNLGHVVKMEGDCARAGILYQEALQIFEKLGDVGGVGWSLSHLGDVAREQKDVAAARSLYERALETFRRLGDRRGEASALTDLGNLSRDENDLTTAYTFYKNSLRLCREIGHKGGIARALEGIAGAAASEGQAEFALVVAGAASAIRQTLSHTFAVEDQALVDRSLEPARRALPPSAATAASMAGWAMSAAQAAEYVLTPPGAERTNSA